MTIEDHSKRHELLHQALEELVADFVIKTGKSPSRTSIKKLIEWSFKQCNPETVEK